MIGAVDGYAETDEVPTHFLGAVVLTDQTRPGASTTKVRQVIDGHDRGHDAGGREAVKNWAGST